MRQGTSLPSSLQLTRPITGNLVQAVTFDPFCDGQAKALVNNVPALCKGMCMYVSRMRHGTQQGKCASMGT